MPGRDAQGNRRNGIVAAVDRVAYAVFKSAVRFSFRLYFGLRIAGRSPRSGPFIVVANHTSFLDAFLVGMSCRARVRFLMTEEYAGLRGAGWLFRWMGVIVVRRGVSNRETIRNALAALRAGEAVGIFPEGGISVDGRLAELQSGAVALAIRSGAPIVPIGIDGAWRALHRHARLPRPHRIRIRVGDPIPAAVIAPRGLARSEALAHGTGLVRREMARSIDAAGAL